MRKRFLWAQYRQYLQVTLLPLLTTVCLFEGGAHGDGTLDPTFSDDGMCIVDVDGFSMHDEGSEMALDDEGRVVLVGGYHTGGSLANVGFAALRIKPDATLDESFGSDGIVTFNEYGWG